MFQIEELYSTYKKDLYQYLLHLTHNPTLSEDLLSETFVCAIKSLPTYKGNSSIKTWLFGISRNLWLQSLRGSNREQLEEIITVQYIQEGMDDYMIKKEMASRIQELLTEKDEKTRKVVSMRIHGYSYIEISSQIGISENSARVLDFRTKNWIKMKLKQEGLYYEEN
ncbi:MAG: RNA polymerase sigma factor [bacterium]|nr:RNA polymerase sigma factor [bacterium]